MKTQEQENADVNNLNIKVRAGKVVLSFASPMFEMGHRKSQGKDEQFFFPPLLKRSCVSRSSCVCLELV